MDAELLAVIGSDAASWVHCGRLIHLELLATEEKSQYQSIK